MIAGATYAARGSFLQQGEPQSKINQAKSRLRFHLLEGAATADERGLDLTLKVFKKMGHDEAIDKINEYAKRGLFLPLSFMPLALTKFCVVRLGEIGEAERFFSLTLKKYKGVDSSSPDIQKLYSEFMWVYIGKKQRDTARLLELVGQCPCAKTYTALCSHYNRSKQPLKTIELHQNWPVGIEKEGVSYRYYAYALKDIGEESKVLQAVYEIARLERPELMDDVDFFVDYIKLGKRSSKTDISSDELGVVEALFDEFPQYKTNDKRFRELLRACFDAKRYDKARAYFMPCVDAQWLGKKTRQLIAMRMAEESLLEAINLYGRMLPNHTRVDFAKASIVLDFHTNTLSSHGAEEYGAEPLLLVELRLWHLYSTLLKPEHFQKQEKQEVKLSLITGKGKKHDLKTFVEAFVKANFGWDCFKYNESKGNSGVIELRLSVKTLLRMGAKLPERLVEQEALR